MKINIIDERSCDEERGSGKYAKWRKDSIHDIRGFVETYENYSDLETSLEIDPNERYYLLYVLYKSGDSFGNSYGNIEYVDLYKTEEEAKASAQEIERHYKAQEKKRDYDLEITLGSGELLKISPPWIGYFKSIESIEIVTVRLCEEPNQSEEGSLIRVRR